MVVWGNKATSLLPKYITQDDSGAVVVPGRTYEAVYPVQGIQTLIPGWETTAINNIVSQLQSNGCTATYFESNDANDTITVQFQSNVQSSETTDMAVPIIVWYIVGSVIFSVLAAWLLTIIIPTSIKEIGGAMTDNPMVTYAIYGIIAIFLIQQINTMRGDRDYDDRGHDRIVYVTSPQ
jgi:hypothetical protein